MTKYISVGKILNFHGIKGEARVGFSKNQQEFLCSLDKIFIPLGNDEFKELLIDYVKINKTVAIVKFKGIDEINDILQYKGSLIFVPEETIREKLEEDEFLIDELVGIPVYDTDDNKLGFIVGVSNNGAHDMLSVRTNSKKICLIPFVKAIVADVKLKAKKVIINNLEGLLE